MITSVFSGIIFLIFPFLCYFIYIIYSKVISNKEQEIFFDLALISSFYLCSRFIKLPILFSFIILIPLLLSIYKNKKISIIILIFLSSFYFYKILDIPIYLFIITYSLIYLLYIIDNKHLVEKFTIINALFLILILLFNNNIYINTNNTLYIIILIIMSYLTFHLTINIYNYLHTVSNTHETLDKMMKEKKLYESLFKITHEIKNPLAVCKGYLDMFDIDNKKKSIKYIGIINQEIDRTLLLLKDFSNISKISVELCPIDINMLLLDVVDESKLILNNIKFKYDIKDDEIYINGDYNRLKQVFLNIIKNSKEAIKNNGKVRLWTEIEKNKIIINIKDNGVGISNNDIKDIGKPFYTTKKNGTGLGVCFSKEIIERHNGNIEYFSKENNGTLVKITLPLEKTSTY